MDNREKKQQLSLLRKIKDSLEQKIEECAEWIYIAEKVTTYFSAAPKGKSGESAIQNAIEHIITLQNEMAEEVIALIEQREKIERAISGISDYTLQLVLRYRYINGETLDEIARKMNYSYRNICYLHGKALSAINFA